jgi:hypothetical protein
MGLLNLFNKTAPNLLRLPSGSFTVDRAGRILANTLPSSFPEELVNFLAGYVLETFREAGAAHLHFSQLVVNYPSLKITAREMRGGAVIFLSPRTPYSPVTQN